MNASARALLCYAEKLPSVWTSTQPTPLAPGESKYEVAIEETSRSARYHRTEATVLPALREPIRAVRWSVEERRLALAGRKGRQAGGKEHERIRDGFRRHRAWHLVEVMQVGAACCSQRQTSGRAVRTRPAAHAAAPRARMFSGRREVLGQRVRGVFVMRRSHRHCARPWVLHTNQQRTVYLS